MVRLKVVKTFADKETFKMYGVGETVNLPDARASLAIKQGLAVEIVEKAKAETEPKKESRKPAKKKKD